MTVDVRLYSKHENARDFLRRRLAEGAQPQSVQMNTGVSPATLELRERLAKRLGWTHRRVVETALEALEALLDEEESG
jgi:hypothetical protein